MARSTVNSVSVAGCGEDRRRGSVPWRSAAERHGRDDLLQDAVASGNIFLIAEANVVRRVYLDFFGVSDFGVIGGKEMKENQSRDTCAIHYWYQ